MRRVLTASVLVAASSVLAACGDHHSNFADANNIGTYVKAGPVTYQLEVSRELNPYSSEDSGYLTGLPKRDTSLAAGEVWYGVFMWAKNTTHQLQKTTASFDLIDTQGNVYRPIGFSNPYVWTSKTLAPGDTEPAPNSTAGYGPTQGGLLLFRLPAAGGRNVYSNRPLTLRIYGYTGKVWATISLDL